MRKDNRGLSLVELIVVIAIMAVMIGVVGFSLSFLFGTEAKQAAQKVSGQLNETKTGAMSRFDETMTLQYQTKDDTKTIPSDGYYVTRHSWTLNQDLTKKDIGTEIRRVAATKVVITVYSTAGATYELGTTNSLTISYDRASGALEDAYINDTTNIGALDKIVFKSGLKEYTIEFTPETGKHVIK